MSGRPAKRPASDLAIPRADPDPDPRYPVSMAWESSQQNQPAPAPSSASKHRPTGPTLDFPYGFLSTMAPLSTQPPAPNSCQPQHQHHQSQSQQQYNQPDTRKQKKQKPSSSSTTTTTTTTTNNNNNITTPFSDLVKSKLQSSTRTGQACDRCKVRKIRCDALPDGCSHCTLQNQPCYVTDRVTGRTERRGYLKDLETQVARLKARVGDLEALLAQHGVEVHPMMAVDGSCADAMLDAETKPEPGLIGRPTLQDGWHQAGTVWRRSPPAATLSYPSDSLHSIPRPAGGYLGAGMDHAPLSSMSGSKLYILGTVIDTGDFAQPDTAEGALDTGPFKPRYNKSVQALLMSMMNQNPRLTDVKLPSREEAFRYAEWYFIVLEKFLPLLHKPTFWQMLTSIYDIPNYRPSASEDVLVHMVFATMLFHYGIRNNNSTEAKRRYHDLSNRHYHYALGRFYELLCERTLQAAQAIALLMVHARNFPKPHVAVILGAQAMGRVWSLGIHLQARPGQFSPLEEMQRRRLFWVVMTVNMSMLGAMGRPMLMTNRDYDVDFPEPIVDEYYVADNNDTTAATTAAKEKPYPNWVGLATFRIVPLYLDMYSHLYSVRRDPNIYAAAVTNLEQRLQAWKSSLPRHLIVDPCPLDQMPPAADDAVTILYIQLIEVQFRFLLRHPNTSMTRDERLAAENVRICEGLADKMLVIATNLRMLKSSDTTWTCMSQYAAFMFTKLAAHWQRRFRETGADIARLREDVDQWLLAINDIGLLIDAGSHAVDTMREIANRTLSQIEADSLSQSACPPPTAYNPAASAASSYLTQALSSSSFFHAPDAPDDAAAASDSDDDVDFPSSCVMMPAVPPSGLVGADADEDEDNDDNEDDVGGQRAPADGWREWTRVVVENPDRHSLKNLLDAGVARLTHVAPNEDMSEQWPMLTYRRPRLQ
ncbi:hypothetical protein TD95_002913 [Thielaviopsis punctulata]|uniref:Zn(2)-C6 fungal-type domain-containing protein n=1 Tax=Thielaviopsis punctulata TaxID=72032 RepID=A0A0F4ZEC4_9PEZI|nr:hypothetical protein TD95_002913 [Thielaviopsis punctulata]